MMIRLKLLLIIFALFTSELLYAQDFENKLLDSIIDSRSIKKVDNLKSVASRLFVEDEKLQYYVFLKWTINYMTFKETSDGTSLKQILRSGKGDCHDYSEIMDSLCKYRGYRCGIVHGFIKSSTNTDGTFNLEGHAWNFIEFNGLYYYTDPLWSEGRQINSSSNDMEMIYVLKSKEQFTINHYTKSRKHRPKYWSFSKFMSYPILTKYFVQIIDFNPSVFKKRYKGLSAFLSEITIRAEYCNSKNENPGFYLFDKRELLVKLDCSSDTQNCHILLPPEWDEKEYFRYSLLIGDLDDNDKIKYRGMLDRW